MVVDTSSRENTEKRNSFFASICELNGIDKRYHISKDDEYFDTHTLTLKAYSFWEWLRFGHTRIAKIDYDSYNHKVIIRVLRDNTIDFCKLVGEFFEQHGIIVVISDDTLKAKETC